MITRSGFLSSKNCRSGVSGGVPMTSTKALTNATLPYAIEIANHGFPAVAMRHARIAKGVNIAFGIITYKEVAEAFDMSHKPLVDVLNKL